MSYLALYRKYRPTKFSEVIGQNHITGTLSNIIKADKIGHAFLFTGSRGTGKTSVAKIFARAINCLTPLEDGSPCGTCRVCALNDNLDVMEIDGASNSGVDEVRELREKVKFLPISSKYKVYIIDEVHMLSFEAFNALLKTLEEPPEHTIFILATTEAHKLPATILSRCMRFDFRLISTAELAALVVKIFAAIGQKADEDAINQIALSGAGSARDTLSIADMCCSYAPQNITYNDVLSVIGASDPTATIEIAQNLLSGDKSGALAQIASLLALGKSPAVLAKDLTGILRDIGVICAVKEPEKLLTLPRDRIEQLKIAAQNGDSAHIVYCIDTLAGIEQDLRYGLSPRLVLENAVLKCCNVSGNIDINTLLAKLSVLQKEVDELKKECLRQEEEES